ncbi:hypothetical protein MRX96_011484 [Rhipicephalus microplus]
MSASETSDDKMKELRHHGEDWRRHVWRRLQGKVQGDQQDRWPSKRSESRMETKVFQPRRYERPKNKTLDGAVVKKYLGQIVDAILFCHRRRVLHRDLKPANVLIDDNGGLKVADFGLCRAFTLPVGIFTHEVVTLWYRAPEILLGASRYSTPVDVWSIGCIFFELLTGKTLFRGDSEIDQLFRIFRVLGTPTVNKWPEVTQLPNYKPTFPVWRKNIVAELLPEVDCEVVDLLQKMLIYSPGERISAKGAAAHPYLAGSTYFKQEAGTTENKGQ